VNCITSLLLFDVRMHYILLASTPSEIISNRVCGIWLGIVEGANVIISK